MRSRLACALALVAGLGCSAPGLGLRACGSSALAELREAHGPVERDHAAARELWEAAAVGALFEEGDGLRTGHQARAVLRVGGSGKAQVEPDTTIRFFASLEAGQAPRLGVEAGQATIETKDEEVPIATQLGAAIIRKGSRVRIEGEGEGARFRVLLGGAAVPARGGGRTELAQGESIAVGIGIAVLDVARPKDGSSSGAAPPSTPAEEGPADAPVAAAVHAVARGDVRHRARDGEAWAPLAAGAETDLGTGDELEVGRGGEASLRRGEEQATIHEGRYRIGAPAAPLLHALSGRLELLARRTDVVIEVPGGTIVARAAERGSRAGVTVRGEDGSTEVEALAGMVQARGASGVTELGEGERATLRTASTAESTAVAAQPVARAPAANRRGEHPDVTVPVGETFRVYDADPPSAVAFTVPAPCAASGAQLEIEGLDPVRGEGAVLALVPPGLRKYALRCLEGGVPSAKSVTRGIVRVVRNDGARKLPTTAPRNDVEADGRRYTIMYQNLRPILNVAWPSAPPARRYVLEVHGPSGAVHSVRVEGPRATVPSNVLEDGLHTLRFLATMPKSASSKETLVEVEFDNAAPTASLDLPKASGFVPAASTRVAGVTVEGSRVSVAGKEIPLDARQRFDAEVPLAPGQRTLAVRFAHPKHGVRYYLRRAAGAAP